VFYKLLGRFSDAPGAIARRLNAYEKEPGQAAPAE
jgi:hypothetical protein